MSSPVSGCGIPARDEGKDLAAATAAATAAASKAAAIFEVVAIEAFVATEAEVEFITDEGS